MDGYNPSPFVLGMAITARTEKVRNNLFALLLPLHDPVRVAEDTLCWTISAAGGSI
jgi:alkanesulfonate monooxygenase SsuD/methylene tetrahydromethanopterin reductase-like flavin-dependent oxidoreductase (luciferase family)